MNENDISYPSQYSSRVILKDGSAILFRPIKLDDAQAWLDFYHRISKRSIYLRLHHTPPEMTIDDAVRFCTADYQNQFAFVAEAIIEKQKQIVAVGRYNRMPDTKTAEIAFIIQDEYQEKGIGTKLIEWLATVARQNDIDTFEAYVLPENTTMLSTFQGYGFHMKEELENGIYHITFPLTRTPEVVREKDSRTLQSTLKSLEHILKPHSVAVIGATNRPGAIGRLVFQSMLQSGFSGVVYPVSMNYDAVLSVKAYRSVLGVPGDIDLAIITVPAAQVLNVVDECGKKKVKGLIIISDGFKEKGPEGAVMERDVANTAFGYGMRIIGPNCMGIINTDPAVKLNATFSLINPPQGNLAFISQSGALGLGVLEYAQGQNIGFSSFISVGNRADIAATDMLQYWEKDPATKAILLYLESFDNLDIFSRVSRRVSASKPILAIKGGSTAEGSRASRSHTGAMATPDVVSDALLKEAGIVAVNSMGDLFESAILLANQPVPRGRRVAILTNGGGPGILAADSCSRNGLKVPELSTDIISKLKPLIKRDISINNPLDLTAGVSSQEFEDCLKILAEDPGNDAVITIFVPPAGLDVSNIESAIGNAVPVFQQSKKPVLTCFVGLANLKGKQLNGMFIPYYLFPENAAAALSNAVKYHELINRPSGTIPVFKDIERDKGHQLVSAIMKSTIQRPIWAANDQISELFKYYGIRFAETRFASTAEEAADVATKTGFPVAIKLDSATITHKTDVGGVVLNVKYAEEAKQAFLDIKSNLERIGRGKEMQGVSIQHMVTEGTELIVGVTSDTLLGHVIMFGMGGVYAEIIKDTAVRLLPLTDVSAAELINSIKMSALFKGYRGSLPLDTEALTDLLLRVSAMVEDIPQITEMDLNPVKLQTAGHGYQVVDARISIK